MRSFSFTGSIFSHPLLDIAVLFSVIILPTLGATFNAEEFFLYIDQSCTDLGTINDAGDDMNALVTAAQGALAVLAEEQAAAQPGQVPVVTYTQLQEKTFAAYFGRLGPPDQYTMRQNSFVTQSAFGKLGTGMIANKYSLYCDGSAVEWVTTQKEGANDGKPFDDPKGPRWYIPANRRPKNTLPLYIIGPQRDNYCDGPSPSKPIGGASTPGKPYIILCPPTFALPYKTLLGVKDTQQPTGTRLNDMTSIGAVMLHEFSHAILSTNANQPETYEAFPCISLAAKTPGLSRKNADNYMFFAMAIYLEQNAWVLGFAQDKTAYDRSNPSRRMARRRRLLDAPLYPLGNSTTASAIGSAIGTLGTTSSTIASYGPTATGSAAASSTNSGLASSSNYVSVTVSSSSSIFATGAAPSSSFTVNLPSTSSSNGAGLSSSLSSVLVIGSGILPFPTTTSSSLASSETSTLPLSFSGTWTDVSAPTPVSFTWFDIPTGTISDAAATSEAVFLGGLFFALQANRQWLTDPELKSQYLDDVKKTQDEALALFNDLNIKPPEPDCSNTKKKRNALSERQLRTLLSERSIISGIAGAIGDAIHDVAKLISCAVNVVKNLADSVEADVPDIDEIENLTDTLAEIGKDLEDADDTESSSTEESSSSTSSCTASTAVPICTQTVSLSTSFVSGGTSSFTVATVTQTTCSITTIAGCTGKGTTTTTTASTASYDYDLATEADFPIATDGPFPSQSLAYLSSVIMNEYTESVSYASPTVGPATSTASSGSAPTSISATESTSSTTGPSFFGSILSGLFSVTSSSTTESASATTSLTSSSPTSSSAAPPSSTAPPSTSAPSTTSRPPPAASPTREAKFYFWHEDANGGEPAGSSWYMFLYPTTSFTNNLIKYCQDQNGVFADSKITMTDPLPASAPWWPTATFDLPDADGGEGCVYTSDGTYPGILNCPGKPIVSCVEDANAGVPIVCDDIGNSAEAVYPMVLCGLPN